MKLRSKYNIGDEVWVMDNNRPAKCRIKSIFFFTGESLICSEGIGTRIAYTLTENKTAKDINRQFEETDRNNRIFTSLDSLLESL